MRMGQLKDRRNGPCTAPQKLGVPTCNKSHSDYSNVAAIAHQRVLLHCTPELVIGLNSISK